MSSLNSKKQLAIFDILFSISFIQTTIKKRTHLRSTQKKWQVKTENQMLCSFYRLTKQHSLDIPISTKRCISMPNNSTNESLIHDYLLEIANLYKYHNNLEFN